MQERRSAEVVIVGAGPAGLSCAKVLTDKGIKPTVLERTKGPGAKNFYSGIVSQALTESIFGGIDLAFERYLSEYRSYFLDDGTFTLASRRENKAKDFIILRETVSAFMLRKVKAAGAEVLNGTVATNLAVENKKITGVITDKEELSCNLVVIAEGMLQILTKASGLRAGELMSDEIFIFVEENIELTSELIEERLNLEKGVSQGLAAKFFGSFKSLEDLNFLGYFYTNKKSITIGSGALLSDLIERAININECQEKIKSHGALRQILKSGFTNYYSSYTLPAYGRGKDIVLPRLSLAGCLLVGGAAMLVNPYSFDISELAITSGKLAGETISRAKSLNDYSQRALLSYERTLNEHPLVKELKSLGKSEMIYGAKDKLNSFSSYVLQERR